MPLGIVLEIIEEISDEEIRHTFRDLRRFGDGGMRSRGDEVRVYKGRSGATASGEYVLRRATAKAPAVSTAAPPSNGLRTGAVWFSATETATTVLRWTARFPAAANDATANAPAVQGADVWPPPPLRATATTPLGALLWHRPAVQLAGKNALRDAAGDPAGVLWPTPLSK